MVDTSLADALLTYRANNQLTQTQLADQLGVSLRTVGNWELGRNLPQAPARRRIEAVLGGPLAFTPARDADGYDAEPIEQSIAETLRVEMARHMLNQEDVAAAVQVSQSQFSKMLRGQRPMTVGQADRALRAVGLPGLELK
ncbi:helix-turn-helix transcriptional regulator [Curtobacterium citreum]|uniref:helix-turn-helix transcriptional regulator n=1 Tax=Curtobacterium citreum TaxID=2036 RepID=UPI00254BCA01|nr:helix-turn-helix transcriptional regulator [Curtobacterium citreum]MDK8171739.1 helix-turn-helix transcriptional regulator [Curtobacterium citreum]